MTCWCGNADSNFEENKVQKRKLGNEGLEVSALGLGCMGMSAFYGNTNEKNAIFTLHRSLDLGVNFWDTAELYGPFLNEELIGKALQNKSRCDVIIATKYAWKYQTNGEQLGLDSSPAHIKQSIEGSLKRLGTDYIDLYYQHRLDPNTPIEETVGAMAELVKQGKVRCIGLSEVGPGIIRRAHAVHPLTAIQSEYSLWERDVENQVLPLLKELGIGFVAYSPIGRGFLAGRFQYTKDLDESDVRRTHPRFQDENVQHNLKLVEVINQLAKINKVTSAQIALAWLLKKGSHIVPIPGTKQILYLEENVKAVDLNLPKSTWEILEQALTAFRTAGTRYSETGMKTLDNTE